MKLLSNQQYAERLVDVFDYGIGIGSKIERERILKELEVFDVDEHQLIILETVLKIVKGEK